MDVFPIAKGHGAVKARGGEVVITSAAFLVAVIKRSGESNLKEKDFSFLLLLCCFVFVFVFLLAHSSRAYSFSQRGSQGEDRK